VKEELNNNVLA